MRSPSSLRPVVAVLVAALAFVAAGALAQAVSAEEGAEREWTGTIDSVETQSRTLLLQTDEAIRKLLYEDSTEIVEDGERVDVSRLEPGTPVRVDAVKRGFDFVAVRIVIEEPAD
jgi:hypothetical protein